MHHPTQVSCTPNNNIFAKLQQNRFKQTIVGARGGGVVEATKRLLSQLPISAQSYSNSPYLDLSLFSYDDKWVSMLERPKGIFTHTHTQFYSVFSNNSKFTFMFQHVVNIQFDFLVVILVCSNSESILVYKIVVHKLFADWLHSHFIRSNRLQSVYNVLITIMLLIFIFEIPKRLPPNSNLK